MADNVAITAGAGTTVAADEVVDGTLGTVKVQYVKFMDGALDGTAKAGVNASGLGVHAPAPKRTQVTSGGLTTATTAYTAGDQVGTIFTFPNYALASGGGGYIESIMLSDETAIIGTYTVWLFRSTVTAAADNAAFSLSDADAQLLVGPPITLGPAYSAALNNTVGWYGSLPYDLSGTSLFALLQTNAGHTFFGATTSLKLTVTASVLG